MTQLSLRLVLCGQELMIGEERMLPIYKNTGKT